mgnify:FL=1
MSHIKDRLSDYHDFVKKLADDHQMVLASDVLEMIEQLQGDLEQDEKENGWIPVSERLPEEDGRYLVTFKYGIKVCMVGYGSCKRTVLGYPIGHGWYSLEEAQYYAEDSIIAWMPLPEPYKED